jgi:uncharacterized integral membrane protein
MIALFLVILFGIFFAFFATQNTQLTSITFVNSQISIPLYLVALSGLLMGVAISSVLSFFDAISTFFTIHGKNSAIHNQGRTIAELKRKIHDLEVENTRLREVKPGYNVFQKPRIIG